MVKYDLLFACWRQLLWLILLFPVVITHELQFVWASVRLEIGHSSYFSAHERYFDSAMHSSQHSVLGLASKGQTKSGLGQFLWDTQIAMSAAEEQIYFEPFAAYWRFKSKWGDLQLGRHRAGWSELDEFWQVGMWNPRWRWDPLLKKSSGLTGVFWQPKSGDLSGQILFSPIFIPEMGVRVKEKNQQLVSTNPWHRRPLQEVVINGTSTPINYDLQEPTVNEVLPSLGVAAKSSWTKKWGEVSAALSYKPMNMLYLGADVALVLPQTPGSRPYVEANVQPEVAYEKLALLEYKSGQGLWEFWLSTAWSAPEIDAPNDLRLNKTIDEAWLNGAYLSHKFWPVYFGALAVVGGDGPDSGEFEFERSNFPLRYDHTRAIRCGLKPQTFYWQGQRFLWQSELTYDDEQKAGHWMLAIEQSWSNNLAWEFRTDLIGQLNEQNTANMDGFYRYFRTNDRVQAKVTYVF